MHIYVKYSLPLA